MWKYKLIYSWICLFVKSQGNKINSAWNIRNINLGIFLCEQSSRFGALIYVLGAWLDLKGSSLGPFRF